MGPVILCNSLPINIKTIIFDYATLKYNNALILYVLKKRFYFVVKLIIGNKHGTTHSFISLFWSFKPIKTIGKNRYSNQNWNYKNENRNKRLKQNWKEPNWYSK